jgi:hypothetical protein
MPGRKYAEMHKRASIISNINTPIPSEKKNRLCSFASSINRLMHMRLVVVPAIAALVATVSGQSTCPTPGTQADIGEVSMCCESPGGTSPAATSLTGYEPAGYEAAGTDGVWKYYACPVGTSCDSSAHVGCLDLPADNTTCPFNNIPCADDALPVCCTGFDGQSGYAQCKSGYWYYLPCVEAGTTCQQPSGAGYTDLKCVKV